MMHWGNGLGMGFGGGLFIVTFWILVIVGIAYIIKLIMGSPKSEDKSETAHDILNKRYARGEISKEEFNEKKKDIL